MKIKDHTIVLSCIILFSLTTTYGLTPQCTPYTHVVAPGYEYKGIIEFEGLDLDIKKAGLQKTLQVPPGKRINAQARWSFGTACPNCRFYVNVFGSWEKKREIAKLYAGNIGTIRSSAAVPFFFKAPEEDGEYIVRAIFLLGDRYANDFYVSNIREVSCKESIHVFFLESVLKVAGELLEVEITAPRSETGLVQEALGGIVTINASIYGKASGIAVFIDGKNVSNTLPYQWNTQNATPGIHIIAVEALGNNTRERDEVRVELLNTTSQGTSPPVLWIKEFTSGLIDATLSRNGKYILTATNDGVSLYNETGTAIWQKIRKDIRHVSISPNGSASAIASKNTLFYLSAVGDVLWNHSFPGDIRDLALSQSGMVVVAIGKGLYYLDRDGTILWNSTLEADINALTVSEESDIAVASQNRIYLLSNESIIKWSYLAPVSVFAIASTRDGRVVAGAEKDLLYLSDGTLIRSLIFQEPIITVSISEDGDNVLVASKKLLSLYRRGDIVWSRRSDGTIRNAYLSNDASTMVYIENNKVAMLQKELKKKEVLEKASMDFTLAIGAVLIVVIAVLTLYWIRKKKRVEKISVAPPTPPVKKGPEVEIEKVSESLKALKKGSLVVHIVNSKSKRPVLKAKVRLNGKLRDTDEKGRAIFENITKGKYRVRVERRFYEPLEAEHTFHGPEERIRLELTPIYGLRDENEIRLKAAVEDVKRGYEAVSHLDKCLPGYFKSIAANIVEFVEAASDIPEGRKIRYEDLVNGLLETAEDVCKELKELILDWRNVRLYEVAGKPEEDCVADTFLDPLKLEKATSDPRGFVESSMPLIRRKLSLVDDKITSKIGSLTITPLSGVWKIAESLIEKAEKNINVEKKTFSYLNASIALIFADAMLRFVEDMMESEKIVELLRHDIL